MDTNKSKFTDEDFRELRKDFDSNLSPKQARKENRERRERLKRQTRRREKNAFNKLLRDGDYDDAEDFWKR